MVFATIAYTLLAVFSGYVTVSIILLNFPGILHKKKKTLARAAHISHRGGGAENTENTLRAFRHAVNCGTDMLEMDVCLTKDKKIIICHDENLKRLCGVDNEISKINFKDLPPLKRELPVLFYGKNESKNEGNPEQMCELEDVFKEFPSTLMSIEIKGKEPELIKMTSDLIKKYNREKITIWSKINGDGSNELYKENSNIPVCFSMRSSLKTVIYFYTGLLPFIPLKETHFAMVLPRCYKHNAFASFTERLIYQYGGTLLSSKILINHLKKRGIPTHLWVVNYEDDFQKAFDLGAEGVLTDCPNKLSNWLNEHPQYKIKKSL